MNTYYVKGSNSGVLFEQNRRNSHRALSSLKPYLETLKKKQFYAMVADLDTKNKQTNPKTHKKHININKIL